MVCPKPHGEWWSRREPCLPDPRARTPATRAQDGQQSVTVAGAHTQPSRGQALGGRAR